MFLSKKSIYANPYKYAYICDVPIEYARIVQKRENNIAKIVYNARKCPKCGSRSLCFEGGSYEEGYGDYIYCDNENCEETFLVSDINNGQYLSGWFDFDSVLWASRGKTEEERAKTRSEECYSEGFDNWSDFIWNHIRG